MDNRIHYPNTDLDFVSKDELTDLVAAFEANGVFSLHVNRDNDGTWRSTFEVNESCDAPTEEPEEAFAAMLTAIESFGPPPKAQWYSCTLRELNIGYDCGMDPWAFNQGLSSQLLGRVAAVGASLRITLYPMDSAPRPAVHSAKG